VEALARSLWLSDPERDLLYRLAGPAAPGLDVVPSRVTPSVQRLLDRPADNPVVVYDATWTLVLANAPYDALMGETSTWHGIERNAVRRNLTGHHNRVVHTPAGAGPLRGPARRRPARDRGPLSRRPRAATAHRRTPGCRPTFHRALGLRSPALPRNPARHKVIDHPAVGRIALDCDTLVVAQNDLRLMVYSAEPGTEDADRLALAIVLGTQTLVD
jgi:hypothetical protein